MEKLQRKTLLLGMFGIALTFGLLFTACDDDSGGGGGSLPAAKGKLTVTSIPAVHNGKYIMAQVNVPSNLPIMGIKDVAVSEGSSQIHLVQIAGGTAILPLYYIDSSDNTFKAYDGTETGVVVLAVFASSPVTSGSGGTSPIANGAIASVSFTNGSGTGAWTSLPD